MRTQGGILLHRNVIAGIRPWPSIVLALLALGCSESAGPSNGPLRITFESKRNGTDYDLFSILPDGSGLTTLFAGPGDDRSASWAPDGSRFAFVSTRGGDQDIYVADADGTHLKNLTNNPARDQTPAWSPDGSRIAFVSDRSGNNDILLMNPDGSDLVQLTTFSGSDVTPAWAPNSRAIAFSSTNNAFGSLITVMNADGSNQTPLPATSGVPGSPSWSPDGRRIVYSRSTGYPPDLYTITPLGDSVLQLTNNDDSDFGPQYSPDGTRILFGSDRSGGWTKIYLMNADGTNPIQLTNDTFFTIGAHWRPGK
jgi:Tol biopolymer transport system component